MPRGLSSMYKHYASSIFYIKLQYLKIFYFKFMMTMMKLVTANMFVGNGGVDGDGAWW
jgi:hypothetical protein